ncbi:MAG: autotransporter outer membrane beta-barrel domain-containing protein [Paracoccaceae bacterium]
MTEHFDGEMALRMRTIKITISTALGLAFNCLIKRVFCCFVVLAVWMCLASPSGAQNIRIGDGGSRFADQALATFGLVAVPNETASALSLKKNGSDENAFFAGQFGGGFRVSPSIPIYLEGYLGFQRYDPLLIVERPTASQVAPVQWNGVSATGGVGYDFRLTDHWSFRPIANLSLGHIASDSSILAGLVSRRADDDLDFLVDGSMSTGGYGGSLLLNYEKKSRNGDIDVRIRHTHLELQSIFGDADLNAQATAVSTSLWTRARIPIGNWQMLGKPVRSVWEASITDYSGDQGKVLDIDWLARLGTGLELDTSGTKIGIVSRARAVVYYVFGEDYNGVALGLGVSF